MFRNKSDQKFQSKDPHFSTSSVLKVPIAKSRTSEELSVLATIQSFSDAIKNNSADILHSLVLPSGSCTRTGINPSSHVSISQSQLVKYISEAAAEGDLEGIFDPEEATVKVDGDIAIVWTIWKSFKAGKMTHKGRIVFLLAKDREEDKWIIVSNANNMVAS